LNEIWNVSDRVSVLRDGRLMATLDTAHATRRQLVELLVGRQLAEVDQALNAAPVGSSGERSVLEVTEIRTERVEELSFHADRGSVVGFYGLTGSGVEQVLGGIFGAVPRLGGDVRIDGRPVARNRPDKALDCGMGYLPSGRLTQGCVPDLTARENLTLGGLGGMWRKGWLDARAERREAASWFEKLDIRPRDGFDKPMRQLSGGNQQKVLLAKWLRRNPIALLLDEPSQGVDVGAKATIHGQVRAAAQTGVLVLVHSTDIDELVAICDRVIVIRQGRAVGEFAGSSLNASAVDSLVHEALEGEVGDVG
jgi:ribose transport system ATP-binding protein